MRGVRRGLTALLVADVALRVLSSKTRGESPTASRGESPIYHPNGAPGKTKNKQPKPVFAHGRWLVPYPEEETERRLKAAYADLDQSEQHAVLMGGEGKAGQEGAQGFWYNHGTKIKLALLGIATFGVGIALGVAIGYSQNKGESAPASWTPWPGFEEPLYGGIGPVVTDAPRTPGFKDPLYGGIGPVVTAGNAEFKEPLYGGIGPVVTDRPNTPGFKDPLYGGIGPVVSDAPRDVVKIQEGGRGAVTAGPKNAEFKEPIYGGIGPVVTDRPNTPGFKDPLYGGIGPVVTDGPRDVVEIQKGGRGVNPKIAAAHQGVVAPAVTDQELDNLMDSLLQNEPNAKRPKRSIPTTRIAAYRKLLLEKIEEWRADALMRLKHWGATWTDEQMHTHLRMELRRFVDATAESHLSPGKPVTIDDHLLDELIRNAR